MGTAATKHESLHRPREGTRSTHDARKPARLLVNSLTTVRIRRDVEGTEWRWHRTRKVLEFTKAEGGTGQRGEVLFRKDGWLIAVRKDKVIDSRELEGAAMGFFGVEAPAQREAPVPADRMTRASGERGDD